MVLNCIYAVPVAADPASPGAAGAAVSAQVEDLAWLAGCWRSEEGGEVVEECWLAPRGEVMLGVNRAVSKHRTGFEFLRIADPGEGLAYLASPGGAAPTAFRLVELGEERAVFANPDHDFPQRVLYWKEGGRLRARVDGVIDGKTQAIDFDWERASPGW
jgi:hypothetical protein